MGSYRQYTNDYYIEKLRTLLAELPDYCRYFFNAKNQTFEKHSEYAYAKDLKVFYEYIIQRNPIYKGFKMKEIPASIFDDLNEHDIEDYMEFLEKYEVDGDQRKNGDRGKRRKFASLQTFCKYMKAKGFISNNPVADAERPTIHKKDIITLTQEEKEELFHAVTSGYGMTT